ncbi:hypothetical protein [Actinacidiphila epipremni]|jgi:hypothetical protein|uniref:Uncharacterized protein n=1 Tax=Actinacidiphila epipremni TaxID=2053013 RepID=A0ABX0ZJW8_9ACTN|nr:hypothetical protein [Actinacidiphila epipremni]NJP43412.1 hypothetical protein [Actinacidiphila epipremni]
MAHHHKSNRAVEGNPDTGHSRGMPERPDDDRLQARTATDRREVAEDERGPGPRPRRGAGARTRRPAPGEGSEAHIADWTQRLVGEAPTLPPDRAEGFVHDLYYAAQRALDKEVWEADFERDE